MRLLFTAIFKRFLSSIHLRWYGYSSIGLFGWGCSTWIREAVELADSCETFGDVDFDGASVFAADFESLPSRPRGSYGDCLFYDRDHYYYWAQLVRSGDVPDGEYEEYPRGRVSYDEKTGKYTLLADRCILGRKNIVSKILSGMNLPLGGTKIDTDNHYRCYRCLRGRNVKQ
jgi:hypothetical protein